VNEYGVCQLRWNKICYTRSSRLSSTQAISRAIGSGADVIVNGIGTRKGNILAMLIFFILLVLVDMTLAIGVAGRDALVAWLI
jgi:hypothetical protein